MKSLSKLLPLPLLVLLTTPAAGTDCKPDHYEDWVLANAAIYGAQADYPAYARTEKREGRTTVRFFIDKTGEVTNIDTLVSSGYADLDQAARQAYFGKKTVPLMCNGKPHVFSTHKTFTFALPPETEAAPPSPEKRERILFIIGKLGVAEHVEHDVQEFSAKLIGKLKEAAPGLEEARYQHAASLALGYIRKERIEENRLTTRLIKHFNQRFNDDEVATLAELLDKPGGRAFVQKLAAVEKDAFALTSRWVQRTGVFAVREAVSSLGGRLSRLDVLWENIE